ncbi:MAG: DUF3343 domain-containing protein [Clostridiales bacterium]|nr:DUF3343 domain-containing protein [Clostridiales bacterium]
MIILAVFRSRAQSLDYGQKLNVYGIPATTMPTPKEAKIGCGLCVRFDARYLTRARAILKTVGYSTFKGFYRLDYVNGRITVFPYG